MKTKQSPSNIVHFIIFVLAIILLFKIVEPLISIFLSSIIITYVCYPLYRRIKRKVPSQFFSIMLTLLIIALILLLPFSYLAFKITQQTFEFYDSLSGNIAKGAVLGFKCKRADTDACIVINNIEKFSATSLSQLGFDKYLQKGLARLVEITTDYLIKIPQAILGTGLALFIAYFLFRDGESIVKKMVHWLPFRRNTVDKLLNQFKKITHTIVFAQLFVALSQGIVGMIGFYTFGVPLPIFWGMVMAFFALVPTVGTAMVWVPASLFLALSGYLTQDYFVIGKGIGLFLFGIFIISTIDNILRVTLIHSKADVHPLVVIAGIIGGVNLFGVIGLFLGPILLSMLITYFETFKERFM